MSRIEFEDVSFRYSGCGEQNILDHASFSFDSDRITVLTGPTGCGKSTMLYLAAGIYPQNAGSLKSGKVLVSGQEISQLLPDRRCALVGMMFQNPDLQFCMDTVENEIKFCLGNISTPLEAMDEIIRVSLEACGISDLRDRTLRSLSGGEKQKAMLACMTALRPRWLLLDEPFANIDEESAADLVQKIVQLHRENVGVVVVDHRLDYWLNAADEIRLMNPDPAVALPPEHHDSRSFVRIESKAPEKPVLKLIQLTVERGGRTVLDALNYEFQQGKVYAILGRSGSGKSSLFNAISGAYRYRGEILLKGRYVRRRAGRKVGAIGFVTQNAQDQFVADTVRGEIEVSLKHCEASNDSAENAESILRSISLWGHRNFSPYMLSQGQQRRLGVAALLAYDCELLICDEPTYAQDRDNAAAIMNALSDKVLERGITLIFSTHDRKLAENYADVILELKEGKLYERAESGMQAVRHSDADLDLGCHA